MIQTFWNQGTEDIFNGVNSKMARRVCSPNLWQLARRKLDQINFAADVESLRTPPGDRLKSLSGDRGGQFSIRINSQYRICFYWSPEGAEEVEIVDYH